MLMTISQIMEETGIKKYRIAAFLDRYAIPYTKRTKEYGKSMLYDIQEEQIQQLIDWLQLKIKEQLDEIEVVKDWLARSRNKQE